jgi:hypothetical protein
MPFFALAALAAPSAAQTGQPVGTMQFAGNIIVRDGRPSAIIVTADRPTAVGSYAAQELVYHLE